MPMLARADARSAVVTWNEGRVAPSDGPTPAAAGWMVPWVWGLGGCWVACWIG